MMHNRTPFIRLICAAAATVVLMMPASAVAQQDALFAGDTADFWLVNPDSGQLTAYDYPGWLGQYDPAQFSGFDLSNGDVVLINALSNSSMPMTPGQPAISLAGIGAAALSIGDGGQGGYRDLILLPATDGPFTETTAVSIQVSSALLATADHTLSWTVTRQADKTILLKQGTEGQDGYYTETFYLVDNGIYNVDVILRNGATTVATASAVYTMAIDMDIDPSQRRRDTDGDGIPDSVELDMGLNPLTDDWTTDVDGDGWSEFDSWLRRFCLDPDTRQPLDTQATCLDADGLPLDTDSDNWTDFDEILRGTNPNDPEPVLVQGATPGGGTGPAAGEDINFCTADNTFYFNLRFSAAANDATQNDVILRIGADGQAFSSPVERIQVNFGETGAISRGVEPEVISGGTPVPPNRWLNGLISDFTIISTGPGEWQVRGSVPVGTQPFIAGDSVFQVAIRHAGGSFFGGPYIVSANVADCGDSPSSPASELSEFESQQRLRFKDYPAATRLYEVEHVIAAGAGILSVPTAAVLNSGQQSAGTSQVAYQGIVVQSFTAAQDNIAGVDVMIASDAETIDNFDDIILNIWGGSLRDGELLLSQKLENVVISDSIDQQIEFRFEAIPLTPGQTYYLEFRKKIAQLVTTEGDTLAGGAVIEVNGAAVADKPDLVLATWYDGSYANGIGGTRAGMQWWTTGAADIRGRLAYDAATLLRDEDIVLAGLTPGEIVPRRRMTSVQTAFALNQLPPMRLPAGISAVISAVHRFEPDGAQVWQPPAGYSRVYKTWLPRLSDVTPLAMVDELGEGAWTTPDEWRREFIAYIGPRLTLAVSPQLDEDSTMRVSVIEAALSEESRLDGVETLQLFTTLFQPGVPSYDWQPVAPDIQPGQTQNIPLPGLPQYLGQPGQPLYASKWEDNLQRLTAGDFNLDQSVSEVSVALGSGMPLESLGVWMRQQFYSAEPGSQSDEHMAHQLRRSFDSNCFVPADLEAGLQADVAQWSAFLDECPVYFDENERNIRLAADQDRRYQVRLNLLPGAAAELLNDATLLDLGSDSDSDGIFNQIEIDVPVQQVTLPWLNDSDGDLIPDGSDECPNDPLNECSANPVLPGIVAEIDFSVLEPGAGSEVALISIQLERMVEQPVTVYYEAVMGSGDTATANVDFQAVSGSVVIASGQQSALIEVPIFADGLTEGAEWFSVLITGVDNGVIADDGIVVVTLNDSDLTGGLPPVVVLAANMITVDERATVNLDASGSYEPDSAFEVISWSWIQIDSGAPLVTIAGSATATPSFTAPEILNPVSLLFEVTVTSTSGLSAAAQVTVLVNPVNDPPFVIMTPSYQVISGMTLELADETLLTFVGDPENDPLSIGAIIDRPAFGTLTDTGNGFSYISDGGAPALVADQVSSGAVGGGYNSPVVQTFIPQQMNLAGVDAFLSGTGALTSNVTLNVWINTALRIGSPVASVTLQAVPRGTTMEFRFPPVFVVPGSEYALEFIIADALVMGAVVPGNYPNGAVIEGGGNLFNGAVDLQFTTYSDPAFTGGLPGNVTVAQLSDAEIGPPSNAWQVSGTGDHVILYETGVAADLPGSTQRIVDYDLTNQTRSLLLEGESAVFHTAKGTSVTYISTARELYRYDPNATQPLISSPLPATLPANIKGYTAVDPRTGDLHYCSEEPDIVGQGWYRIDSADLSVSPRYGSCFARNRELPGVKAGNRFCVLHWAGRELYCTEPGGNVLSRYLILDSLYNYAEGLGIEQVGNAALLFVGDGNDLQVRLIRDDMDINNPLLTPDDNFPLLLNQVDKRIEVMPEVQELPGGGAAFVFAQSQFSSGAGNLIEMWTWSGNTAETLTQLNIGSFPTLYSHMGKLQVAGSKLYWQVQDMPQDTERVLYEVDPTATGLTSALTEIIRIGGTLTVQNPVPYDVLVSGPNNVSVLEAGPSSLCNIINSADGSIAIENIDCKAHESVKGVGLLFELDDPGTPNVPRNLFLFGVSPLSTTGITSFSVEVSDTDSNTVTLPVMIEVLPP